MEITIDINKGTETVLLETSKRGNLKRFVQEFMKNKSWKRFEIRYLNSKEMVRRLYKSLNGMGDRGLLQGCTLLYVHGDGHTTNPVPSRLEVYKNVRKNRAKAGLRGEGGDH